jgi:hypothetical protein
MRTPPFSPDDDLDRGDELSDDPPSGARVERFLHGIEEEQRIATRTRWVGLGVGTAIAGVSYLTAIGLVPIEAESVVVSAGAVAVGLALRKA